MDENSQGAMLSSMRRHRLLRRTVRDAALQIPHPMGSWRILEKTALPTDVHSPRCLANRSIWVRRQNSPRGSGYCIGCGENIERMTILAVEGVCFRSTKPSVLGLIYLGFRR